MSQRGSGTGVQKIPRIGGVNHGLNTIGTKRKGRAGHPPAKFGVFDGGLNAQFIMSKFDTSEQTKASRQWKYPGGFLAS